MTLRTKCAAASVAALLGLFAVSTADAACRMHVVHHMTVTTHSGKQMSPDVVDYNGHMMALVPENDAPDIFHQMVFRRQ